MRYLDKLSRRALTYCKHSSLYSLTKITLLIVLLSKLSNYPEELSSKLNSKLSRRTLIYCKHSSLYSLTKITRLIVFQTFCRSNLYVQVFLHISVYFPTNHTQTSNRIANTKLLVDKKITKRTILIALLLSKPQRAGFNLS